MRNCQRQRPNCGCHKDVEVIVHPTVHCNVPERHHHKRVRHIIPVVHHQVHHHHKHHEYEVKRKHTHEHCHHEHGKVERDWCEMDRGGCGQRQGHENHNAMAEEFNFDNEMFV